MNDENMKIDELSSLGELAKVDGILSDAAAATDEGDYQSALDGFEHALSVTRRIFGDNLELTELKHKIEEIHELLLLDEENNEQNSQE